MLMIMIRINGMSFMSACSPPESRGSPPDSPTAPQRRTVKLRDLLGSSRELVIDHDGESYSLRLTSKGRLILTK